MGMGNHFDQRGIRLSRNATAIGGFDDEFRLHTATAELEWQRDRDDVVGCLPVSRDRRTEIVMIQRRVAANGGSRTNFVG
jgi:hypothetical protein